VTTAQVFAEDDYRLGPFRMQHVGTGAVHFTSGDIGPTYPAHRKDLRYQERTLCGRWLDETIYLATQEPATCKLCREIVDNA
jgi:hypothetical protein